MTTPNIYANGEGENSYLNVPGSQGIGPRSVVRTAFIPSGSDGIIGLVPFNKGAIVDYGSAIACDALGGAGFLDWGVIYDDDFNFPDEPGIFAQADTTYQAGAVLRPSIATGATFVAQANGFVAAIISGGTTATDGNITFNGTISYQG